MENLRKTVNICCLIYGVYGLISLVQLGTFVPPIPLRPILFLVLLIFYVLRTKMIMKSALSEFIFLLWLTSMVFVGPYFMESWGRFETVSYFYGHVEPIIRVVSSITFSIVIIFLCYHKKYKSWLFYLLVLVAICFIPYSFRSHSASDWGMIGIIFLSFLANFLTKHSKIREGWMEKSLVLNGVGIILLIERLTFLFH